MAEIPPRTPTELRLADGYGAAPLAWKAVPEHSFTLEPLKLR